jgi:DNA-binding transcriptional MerR regulator
LNSAVTGQRPLYGIGTVARLSGIKPDTLRIWERRYGLGASHKAGNGRRMYTQTDLEHLQIVSRLVERGFRIGEIASMQRKTLAAMLEQAGDGASMPAPRPRALFIGHGLCSWLDRHPGCLSGLDSTLVQTDLDKISRDPSFTFERLDLLVVEKPAMTAGEALELLALRDRLGARACAVFYEFSSQRTLSQLHREDVGVAQLPLRTDTFAATLKRLVSSVEVGRGTRDAGDLVARQPRLFRDQELLQHAQQTSALACGCSRHLSDIIQSLVHFEEYSSQCAVESWNDAATHSCVYAYTNQARWLMEKALNTVLEEHSKHVENTAA